MRLLFAIVLVSGSVAFAQPPKEGELPKDVPPRFGIQYKVKAYPQDSAKKALNSTIEAIEKGDTPYIVAHLLDPGFVELRVADRSKQYEAAVEIELSRLRDLQIRNPDKYAPETRLPVDRVKFRALIIERSRERAFRQIVQDMEAKLIDDPQALKDLKKLLRDGMPTDTETGAKLTHMDVKDRALYFRKIDDRWFLENRHEDIPAPVVPPPKKEGM
ncbi:MAG: hypothetical protein K8U57_24680 [Planctomycetes bacterium]|nr:hypothetical protein [Planctomycetota bacterium]